MAQNIWIEAMICVEKRTLMKHEALYLCGISGNTKNDNTKYR